MKKVVAAKMSVYALSSPAPLHSHGALLMLPVLVGAVLGTGTWVLRMMMGNIF